MLYFSSILFSLSHKFFIPGRKRPVRTYLLRKAGLLCSEGNGPARRKICVLMIGCEDRERTSLLFASSSHTLPLRPAWIGESPQKTSHTFLIITSVPHQLRDDLDIKTPLQSNFSGPNNEPGTPCLLLSANMHANHSSDLCWALFSLTVPADLHDNSLTEHLPMRKVEPREVILPTLPS